MDSAQEEAEVLHNLLAACLHVKEWLQSDQAAVANHMHHMETAVQLRLARSVANQRLLWHCKG